jgi:hypothetical protein
MADRRYALLKHQHTDVEVIAPTLLNTWANYGSGYSEAGYLKDSNGIVSIRGLIKDGTRGEAIFTLSEGYRPALIEIFICQAHTGTAYEYGRVDVLPDGNVMWYDIPTTFGTGEWLSLAGITFLAEQ